MLGPSVICGYNLTTHLNTLHFLIVRIEAVHHFHSTMSGANVTPVLLLSAEVLVLQVDK